MKRFLPLLGFIILAFVLAIALIEQPQHEVIELSGTPQQKPLPPLDLFTRDDDPVHIQAASLAGKVVLIDFFASWCTACAEEHRTLLDLSRSENPPLLLGIAWNDSVSRVDDWLAQHRDPYTRVLFDKKGRAAIALGMRGLPESFIVDKHGIVRYHLAGALTQTLYESTVAPLLAKLEQEP